MSETWDDDDRAIARALGAEMPDDGVPVDDRAVADYETVLAALPFDEVAPAGDVEDRVVAAALARPPATVPAIDTKRKARASRQWIGAAVAGVAAAVIVVVLIAGRNPSPGAPGGRIQPAAANGGVAARVLAEPGTRQGVLRTPEGTAGGRVALDPSGSGFLTGLKIPTETTANTLWLDTGSSTVRVGSLPRASTVHFVVHGDVDAVRGVIITTGSNPPESFSLRAPLSK